MFFLRTATKLGTLNMFRDLTAARLSADARFQDTGLERSVALAKDIDWFKHTYGLDAPQVEEDGPGQTYARWAPDACGALSYVRAGPVCSRERWLVASDQGLCTVQAPARPCSQRPACVHLPLLQYLLRAFSGRPNDRQEGVQHVPGRCTAQLLPMGRRAIRPAGQGTLCSLCVLMLKPQCLSALHSAGADPLPLHSRSRTNSMTLQTHGPMNRRRIASTRPQNRLT